VNIDKPQPELVEIKGRAGQELVAGWKAKRRMAERAGGSFIVKAKVDTGDGASGAKRGPMTGWLAKIFKVRGNKE
jgi:hypothetical protein